jgi:hypothetical protein
MNKLGKKSFMIFYENYSIHCSQKDTYLTLVSYNSSQCLRFQHLFTILNLYELDICTQPSFGHNMIKYEVTLRILKRKHIHKLYRSLTLFHILQLKHWNLYTLMYFLAHVHLNSTNNLGFPLLLTYEDSYCHFLWKNLFFYFLNL